MLCKKIIKLFAEIFKHKKEEPKMEPIDLTSLLQEYYNQDIHIAVAQDYSRVIATGITYEEAVENSIKQGYENPIIYRAPDDRLKGWI